MSNIIKFKLLDDKAVLPTKAHAEDIGFDLVCTDVEYDTQNDLVVCHTGLSWEAEPGWTMLLLPRSSVTNTGLYLPNSCGVIDPNYRGEIVFKYKFRTSIDVHASIMDLQRRAESLESYMRKPFWKKLTSKQRTSLLESLRDQAGTLVPEELEIPLHVGDKVGQAILVKVPNVKLEQVDELTETERGDGGFGSTGA